jgi:ubiquinone biosynthesis protein UbiJ
MLQRPVLAALNHLLRQESWARQRLRPFAGRGARVVLPPWFTLDLTVAEDGTFHSGALAAPDVLIRLPEHAPLRFLGRPQEALAAARLEGVADFAEALGFVFRNLRWDGEEALARWVGDVPAHRLAGLGRRLAAWQGDALARLGANGAEFLADEGPGVPRPALAEQAREIAALDGAADALAARLARLTSPSR